MRQELQQLVEKAYRIEQLGDVNAALQALESIEVVTIDEEKLEILLEKAQMKFRNLMDKDALLDFISFYHQTNNQEVLQFILNAYYEPNKEYLEHKMKKNLDFLNKDIDYFSCCEEVETNIYLIWQDDDEIIAYLPQEQIFAIEKKEHREYNTQDNLFVIMFNELDEHNIRACMKAHEENAMRFLGMENAFYLYFEPTSFALFIQSVDIEKIYESDRLFFIVGAEALEQFMGDENVVIPHKGYGWNRNEYDQLIYKITETRAKKCEYNHAIIEKYYSNAEEIICEHVKNGNPKILIYTSLFTTALQFHAKNIKDAFVRCGCETSLIIDKGKAYRAGIEVKYATIASFKPDVIFLLDHFRFEQSFPDSVIVITWVQDYLANIMNCDTPKKLGKKDFILNHFTTADWMDVYGYPKERSMPAPVPSNERIYKKYEVTLEEKIRYQADICMVCHAVNWEAKAKELLDEICEQPLVDMTMRALEDYAGLIKTSEIIFYKQEEFCDYLYQYITQIEGKQISWYKIQVLANNLFIPVLERMYRQALADWLIEAGYTNLKLWGREWKEIPKYAPYAMGEAENGEVLSKILQCSKIVLGNNAFASGAARAWEAMLSGAFYMGNYVPEEIDRSNIQVTMKDPSSIIVFHGKEDLIEKVDFYLTHEDERQNMIKKGTDNARRNATFEALAKKILLFLKENV